MMVRQHLENPSRTEFAVLESFTQNDIKSWPLNFRKQISQPRNCEPTIFANCLIHVLNKIISWHSLPSLATCIMNIYTSSIKVPAPLLHFAVIHECFTNHFSHSSMNFSCISSFSMHRMTEHNSHLVGDCFEACLWAPYILKNDNGKLTHSQW